MEFCTSPFIACFGYSSSHLSSVILKKFQVHLQMFCTLTPVKVRFSFVLRLRSKKLVRYEQSLFN